MIKLLKITIKSWYKNKKKLFIEIVGTVLVLIVLVIVIVVLTKKDKKCTNCHCDSALPRYKEPDLCTTCDYAPTLPQCKDEHSNNPYKCDPLTFGCDPYISCECEY